MASKTQKRPAKKPRLSAAKLQKVLAAVIILGIAAFGSVTVAGRTVQGIWFTLVGLVLLATFGGLISWRWWRKNKQKVKKKRK